MGNVKIEEVNEEKYCLQLFDIVMENFDSLIVLFCVINIISNFIVVTILYMVNFLQSGIKTLNVYNRVNLECCQDIPSMIITEIKSLHL